MFDSEYMRGRLAHHFDDAYERTLLKWNQDISDAIMANALNGARHQITLEQSALTIGKEAISAAFLTFLIYARDRPRHR